VENPRASAPLSVEEKSFVVLRLARFGEPADVIEAFNDRFARRPLKPEILALDPRYSLLSPDHSTLYANERKRVLADPTSVAPYANRAARMISLSDMAADYRERRDLPNARAVFRQLAEEQAAADEVAAAAPLGAPTGSAEIVWKIIDPVEPA